MDLRAGAGRWGSTPIWTGTGSTRCCSPAPAGAAIAAKAGYPSVQVPAGFIAGVDGKETPDYPLGATFTGRAWSEPTLLRLAYAFEQATQGAPHAAGSRAVLAAIKCGDAPHSSRVKRVISLPYLPG